MREDELFRSPSLKGVAKWHLVTMNGNEEIMQKEKVQ